MPTMLLAPASLIEQQFKEARAFFGDNYFDIRVFHGNSSTLSYNPALAKSVMNTDELYAELELAVQQKNTSQVSWYRILCAQYPRLLTPFANPYCLEFTETVDLFVQHNSTPALAQRVGPGFHQARQTNRLESWSLGV